MHSAHSTLSPLLPAGDNFHRGLTQAEANAYVLSSNQTQLGEILETAKNGDTIVIDAEEISLTELLIVDKKDLQIKASSSSRPATIKCTTDEARLEIRSDGVVLENLVIRDCHGPAVRIVNEDVMEHNPFAIEVTKPRKTKEIRVILRSVHFLNNQDSDEKADFSMDIDGGAFQVTESTRAIIEDCSFRGNSAIVGGAIHVNSGSLDVSNSQFIENSAVISGGAISASFNSLSPKTNTTLMIKDCLFLGNKDISGGDDIGGLTLPNGAPLETSEFLSFPTPQSSGGALHLQGFREVSIEGSTFDGNQADPAAGAIFISDNEDVYLFNNTLQNNIAFSSSLSQRTPNLEQGGAIYVAFTKSKSSIRVDKCRFLNNTASYGGGLHMVVPLVADAILQDCIFEDNTAHLGGGGLVLRNAIEIAIWNTKFRRNKATAGGAALFTNGAGARFIQGEDTSRDSVFEENLALDGGACFFLGAGQVSTQRLSFIKNQAQRNGGAVCLVESLASGSIGLQQSYFLENTARRGGALFMDSIATLRVRAPVTNEGSKFVNNKAMAGGAIYLRPSSQVKNVIFSSSFSMVGNVAVKRLEDIYDKPVPYTSPQSYPFESKGRKLMQDYFEDKDNGSDVLLRTTAEDPCSPGGGGGICLVLSEVPERTSVKVDITNAQLSKNKAVTGGGMFIATKKRSTWTEFCDLVGMNSESVTAEPCRQLTIRNVEMHENVAEAAGGAIFASDANQVHYSTEESNYVVAKFHKLSEMLPTKHISRNVINRGGYGSEYASNAVRLEVLSPTLVTGNDGRDVLVANHASGTSLPTIRLRVVDDFGSTVSGGISDSQMKVTVSSSRGIVSGQLVATADAGIVVFDSLIVTADPDIYTLTFQPEEDVMSSLLISLSIRYCEIGEHNITQGKICSLCQAGFYGFDPSIPCQACKAQAVCSGGAVVIPKDGYWHSNPFSPQFHECLVPHACSYKDREPTLQTMFNNGTKPVPRVFSNDEYPQCRQGYKDVLCGSCDVGYGHKPGGECVKCKNTLTTYLIVSVVALWQLILLGFTIRSALASIRDMQDMRAIVAQHNGDLTAFPKAYQTKLASTPSSSSLRVDPVEEITIAAAPGPSSKMEHNDEKVIPTLERPQPSRRNTPSQINLTSIDHIVAAETVSETIKVKIHLSNTKHFFWFPDSCEFSASHFGSSQY